MADGNPEESFTFVDRRKVAGEATASAPVQSEPADVDFAEDEDGGVVLDDSVDTEPDPFGSYGLAAYITGLMAQDAWQKMGLIADPATGKVSTDLNQARFSIDCVSSLVGVIAASDANIPAELQRDLQRVLNDLRLNFVEKSRA